MTRTPETEAGCDDAAGFKSRRSARIDVPDVRARLAPEDVYKVEVTIQNVSTAGFMAICAAPVRIGSYVLLDIPGIGPVEAQVRWQIGPKMGGMFLDPIRLGKCEWNAERAQAEKVA